MGWLATTNCVLFRYNERIESMIDLSVQIESVKELELKVFRFEQTIKQCVEDSSVVLQNPPPCRRLPDVILNLMKERNNAPLCRRRRASATGTTGSDYYTSCSAHWRRRHKRLFPGHSRATDAPSAADDHALASSPLDARLMTLVVVNSCK